MADTLDSDFFSFQDQLGDVERAHILAIREFSETEVRPIADDYRVRAEFPSQLIAGLAGLGLFGSALESVRQFENSAVFRGWAALELARVDAGVATFVGVQNGLSMGAIDVGGSAEQKSEWLPAMAAGSKLGAFGLTEPLSGSDTARGLRTTARRDGESWVLDGAKRWIGNAPWPMWW